MRKQTEFRARRVDSLKTRIKKAKKYLVWIGSLTAVILITLAMLKLILLGIRVRRAFMVRQIKRRVKKAEDRVLDSVKIEADPYTKALLENTLQQSRLGRVNHL